MAESLTNQARPQTNATITVRIIKSFKFRTERSLVLHNVNLITTTVTLLKEMAKQGQYMSYDSIHVSNFIVLPQLWQTNLDGNPIGTFL